MGDFDESLYVTFLRHNNVYLREWPERAVLEEGQGGGERIVEG